MAETYTLQTPQVTPAITVLGYRIISQSFELTIGEIRITLKDDNGELIQTGYGGIGTPQAEKDKAIQLIKSLNTANCTIKSMQKRILEQLAIDGKIPTGSVTGVPD